MSKYLQVVFNSTGEEMREDDERWGACQATMAVSLAAMNWELQRENTELKAKHARRHRKRNPEIQERNAQWASEKEAGASLAQLARKYEKPVSTIRSGIESALRGTVPRM
jgi:hypothetical protein